MPFEGEECFLVERAGPSARAGVREMSGSMISDSKQSYVLVYGIFGFDKVGIPGVSIHDFCNVSLALNGLGVNCLVAVKSAEWGEFIRTVAADHFELVGWNLAATGPPVLRLLAFRRRKAFDHLALYRDWVAITAMSDEAWWASPDRRSKML